MKEVGSRILQVGHVKDWLEIEGKEERDKEFKIEEILKANNTEEKDYLDVDSEKE